MRNLSAAALALTAALAAQPAAAASNRAAPATGLHFVDLTDDFDRVWGETKNLPDDKRVEAFQTGFAKILPGFYAADRVKDWMTPEKYHAFVLKGLKAYPEQRAGIRKVSGQFGSLVAPARKQFESVFGRMTGYPPIYLVVSFGEFDGGTRDLPEGNRLMFGADMIDRLYKTTPIKPFVEHELFHLMHHRNFPECDPVWCNLWEEGLATYVASKLNPGASDTALQHLRGPRSKPIGRKRSAPFAPGSIPRSRPTTALSSWAAGSHSRPTFRGASAIMSGCSLFRRPGAPAA